MNQLPIEIQLLKRQLNTLYLGLSKLNGGGSDCITGNGPFPPVWDVESGPPAQATPQFTINFNRPASLSNVDVISQLTKLKTLSLAGCKLLTTLPDLGRLTALESLDLSHCSGLTELPPLSGLRSLTTLTLSGCSGLSSLPPLTGLKKLTRLDLSGCIGLVGLPPLSGLRSLTTLTLSGCRGLSSLPRLTGLNHLSALNLRDASGLTSLPDLIGLHDLVTLDLRGCVGLTQLPALTGLTKLNTLLLNVCSGLSSLPELSKLPSLTSLDVSWCSNLTSLPDLSELGRLASLYLDGSGISYFNRLDRIPTLQRLSTYSTRFRDLHPAVCSRQPFENCLESVRRYFSAFGPDPQPDAEVKLFVIGNGRAGKTTLIRRLKSKRQAVIARVAVESTQGVEVETFEVPRSWGLPPLTLCIWDFGGQDIYHGTHALFLQEPAIYLLAYSHDTNNEQEVIDGGIVHHNRPLAYWFDYLRQAAGSNGAVASPVLYVQTKCDLAPGADAERRHTPPEGQFSNLSPLIHADATHPEGVGALRLGLTGALRTLLEQRPQPPLPTAWAGVRGEMRRVRSRAGRRTMSRDEFIKLCAGHGCEADASVILAALHQTGVVFYREGIFGDRVVVDHRWVLDAIYTVFTKNEDFQDEIDGKCGRFTRRQLERYFWEAQGHSLADQRVFLGFMEECGICFRTQPGNNPLYEGVYVIPDKLPQWGAESERRLRALLSSPDGQEITAEFSLLHDGIARSFLSRIGSLAGDKATYWRYGCHLIDGRTGCDALIRMDRRTCRLQAWGTRAGELLETLSGMLARVPCGQPPKFHAHVVGELDKLSASANQGIPPDRLVPVRETPLDALMWTEEIGLHRLRAFYLIGRGFKAGLNSFRKLERDFLTRSVRNKWPDSIPLSGNGLSGVARIMGKVFAKYYGKRRLKLYRVVGKNTGNGSGYPAEFTADGWRAWDDVQKLLKRRRLCPKW